MYIHKSRPDLTFNVAQLLREEIGARRSYTFTESRLSLDETMAMTDLSGKVRFTRTASGVLADAEVSGTIEMECTRCLTPTPQHVQVAFRDEFHAKVEVNTGLALPKPDEEDPFFINELHMLDLGEAIREYGLMALPMRPLCMPECLGICPTCGADRNTEPCNCQETAGDDRFAALRALLNE
ncbi:MAG TPA: DUF177 domain-containing protein [Roseiflexaceae bacterium]|nr:DUF177 domain-containing protein [Roseiflexaceae bacterium]HMP39035.1 DUF177 domain-containing protein [Roseiflexaceae bacterium]